MESKHKTRVNQLNVDMRNWWTHCHKDLQSKCIRGTLNFSKMVCNKNIVFVLVFALSMKWRITFNRFISIPKRGILSNDSLFAIDENFLNVWTI